MKTDSLLDLKQQLGADRVLGPPGALPQPAERLDPAGPVRPYEFEVAVERLCLDSTSFRNIRERAGGDSDGMAARILAIVESRGKMHNPETESGGVLLGTVVAVGERYGSPPAVGAADRDAGLADAHAAPAGGRHRSRSGLPQVEVTGTAYVCDRAAWGPVPDDLPLKTALEVYDVCAAATHTRTLAPRGRHRLRARRRTRRQGGARRRPRRDGRRDRRCGGRRRGRRRAGHGARALRHRRDAPTCATRSPPSRRCERPARPRPT